MSARSCPRCAASVPESARFCASCGRDLEAAAPGAAIPPADQVPPPAPLFAARDGEVRPESARPRRRVRGCLLVMVLLLVVGGVGGGAVLISAGALEWFKPLESPTFDTLDQYAIGRHVMLTGELSLSAPVTCYENGKSCVAELVDAVDTSGAPASPRRIFIYVDSSSLESGPKVQLAGGGSVESGALVRVTGRVCRTQAEPPEACVRVEQVEAAPGPVAGASPGVSTPTPVPTPTPEPTPTPTSPVTEDELAAACKGAPIPDAAKYAGTVHPLVVATVSGVDTYSYDINAKWENDLWPGSIQLVLCVDDAKTVKVGSCGTYKRASDGEVGEIIRYRSTVKVRVVVARTGKDLQYRTLAGSTPACATSLSLFASGSPPWGMHGDDVSDDAINAYATSVSTQKVK